MVAGITNNYLVKSYDECNQLTPLPQPAPAVYYYSFQRLDTANVFLMANGNGAELYRSYNGGASWNSVWSNSYGASGIAFFDTLEGITAYSFGNNLLRTLNGGATWTTSALPISPNGGVTFLKGFDDSTVMFANYGDFYLSKDRGRTWPYGWGFGMSPVADFCIVNADTIVGVSGPSQTTGDRFFTRSFNGGASWLNSPAPLYNNSALTYRKPNELYVVGSDIQDNGGMIAKSTDLGQTWSKFNTGVQCRLTNLVFLNDSVALLTGTNGVLLRWKFRNAVFTGISEKETEVESWRVYPNPAGDVLNLAHRGGLPARLTLQITNTLGQTVYFRDQLPSPISMDIGFLSPGVYYLHLKTGMNGQGIKFVKE